MKNNSIRILIFALLSINSYGQKGESIAFLEKYFLQMKSLSQINSDQVYCIRYTMKLDYRDPLQKDMSFGAKLLVSKERSSYESNALSMYADSKNGFLVLPMQKQIIWGPGTKDQKPLDDFEKVLNFQDSLIHKSILISSKQTTEGSDTLLKLKFQLPELISKQTHISFLELTFNKSRNTIKEVCSYYSDEAELKTARMIYETVDFNSTEVLPSAFDKIFAGKKRLNQEFASYELIDNHPPKK